MAIQDISPAEGLRRVQEGALLIDVREPDEYAAVHAKGAQPLALSELPSRFAELPKDRDLVLICRSGGRSARAGEFLVEQGYDAARLHNLAGGTAAWVEQGLPHVEAE
ncbi:rhodanese-like domain-containing protein [Deinococcus lacus]|uniref:Rhodanese-like domain-containing protein n=1 Tax=Deinococcus lacus TaxID=392561 RepID=A0ABW1Y983_9DEIO